MRENAAIEVCSTRCFSKRCACRILEGDISDTFDVYVHLQPPELRSYKPLPAMSPIPGSCSQTVCVNLVTPNALVGTHVGCSSRALLIPNSPATISHFHQRETFKEQASTT